MASGVPDSGMSKPPSSREGSGVQPAAEGSGVSDKARHAVSMREISEIKGLSQASHNLPQDASASHISHVMYDPARAQFKKIVLILTIFAVVGGAAFLYLRPVERRLVWRSFDKAQNALSDLLHKPRKKKKKLSRVSTYSNPDDLKTVQALIGATRRTCSQLLAESSSGGRLSVGERIDLADCQLVIGNLSGAEAALKPVMGRIGAVSEAEINRSPSNRSIADAFQTAVGTLVREGKSLEATKLLNGKCIKWERTNTCVAKAMLYADRRIPALGIEVMFTSDGKLDRKAQSRLWLAGAQIAAANESASVADRRYGLALNAAPRDALALRKTIYDSQAVELFHRNDVPKLKLLAGRAMKELRPAGAEGVAKLKMLLDLAEAPDRIKRTKEMLTREELTFRARRDFDLIEILGPEALKGGLETDYLRLVKRTREFYESKYKAADQVSRKLAIWEIRATISLGDNERALVMTHGYDRQYGADAFSRHMRGVAYHLASSHERYQFMAAQEFQGALRIAKNWESLYALGISLLRSGRKENITMILKDLDATTSTKGQKFWVDMLRAEYDLAQGKNQKARSSLEGWIQEMPQAFTTRQLLIKVLNQEGRTGDADRAEQGLADLGRMQRQQGSKESLASPLGPMALGKRLLE